MARKRQRAKDRKQKLHRENIPGSLDHASGEVEGVEAAIVAGAGGQPVEPAADDVAAEPADAVEADDAVEPDAEPEPDAVPEPVAAAKPGGRRRRRGRGAKDAEPVADLEPIDDAEPLDDEDEGVFVDPDDPDYADADAASVEHGRLGKGAGDLAVTPDAHKPAGFRSVNFIRACWAELQRVDWPDRRQVGQATAVVLGFVVVAGAFLGAMDVVAQRIVDFIL
ncbi:MAG: preprotein translocase subunit SecE [Solirubrobacteraceae bacterium]|nr:preprotein translocase subunit SecE [Solirubrobacteraceae bacterium]